MHKMWLLAAVGFLVLLPTVVPKEVPSRQAVINKQEAVSLTQPPASNNSSNDPKAGLKSQLLKINEQLNPGVVAEPVSLLIPSIALKAPLVRTGLESDGSLRVPGNPQQAGWYTGGPKPGEIGPSVITGHYDSLAGPGVFFHLKKMRVGEEFRVVQNDGTELIFRVKGKELFLQDDFPTNLVYGPISHAGLRIITCAGTYNKATRRYSHDLVVFASLVGTERPQSFQPR